MLFLDFLQKVLQQKNYLIYLHIFEIQKVILYHHN